MTILKSATKAASKPTTTKDKPVGNIYVSILGARVFSRSIWPESTSQTELLAEINDMALNDPEGLKALLENIFGITEDGALTIEIVMSNVPVQASLADLAASLKRA